MYSSMMWYIAVYFSLFSHIIAGYVSNQPQIALATEDERLHHGGRAAAQLAAQLWGLGFRV